MEDQSRSLVPLLLSFAEEYQVDRLLRLVVDGCPRLVGAKRASLFWIDRDRNRLVLRETYEGNRQHIDKRFYEIGEGLTGWVAKSGKALRLKNIENAEERGSISLDLEWSDKYRGFEESKEKEKQRAFIAIPIKIDEIVVGVLRIARTEDADTTFSAADEALLVGFADQLSVILQKAERFERLEQIDRLIDIDYLRDRTSLDAYFHWIVNAIPTVLGAKACSIFLAGGGSNILLKATSEGAALSKEIGRAYYEPGEGLTGWVFFAGEALRVLNVKDMARLKEIHPALEWKGKYNDLAGFSSNFLAAPIKSPDRIWGVVRVVRRSGDVPFTSHDEIVLSRFGNQLGLNLQSRELTQKETMVMRPRWPARYQPTSDLCYALMPLSLEWSENVRREIRGASEEVGLRFGIADEDHGHFVMEDVWTGICGARVVVADLTGGNPNVAYEVGLADTVGKQVVLLAQDPEGVPFDFRGARLIVYSLDRLGELRRKLVERLERYLKQQVQRSGEEV